jgi:hypothetical protein
LRSDVRVTKANSYVTVFQYYVMKECGEAVLDREKRPGRLIPEGMCQLNRSVVRFHSQSGRSGGDEISVHVGNRTQISWSLPREHTADNVLQLMGGCASISVSLRMDVTKIFLWS